MDFEGAPSPLSTFALFSSLPYELRLEIYILATPPRIVHVIEDFELADDERDDFERARRQHSPPHWYWSGFRWTYLYERFQREFQVDALHMVQKLHPDIAYFAHNWRDQLRDASQHRPSRSQRQQQQEADGTTQEADGTTQVPLLLRQTLLSEHGFTTTSSASAGTARRPWQPTPETPEIPEHWLAERPNVAFELLRETYLRSEAPIPALLHTCRDSREALTAFGYELAFGTRSSGLSQQRTWFHFGRDRLYLAPRPFVHDYLYRGEDEYWELFDHRGEPPDGAVEWGTLLAGGWWDVGPFLSHDLRRVRRLVLGRCCGGQIPQHLPDAVANLLPLLPGLQELLLEVWDQNVFDAYVRKGATAEKEDSSKQQQQPSSKKARSSRMWLVTADPLVRIRKTMRHYNRRVEDGRAAQPWRCFRVEEVDALGPMYWKNFQVYHSLNEDDAPKLLKVFVDYRNQRLNSYLYQERLEFSSSPSLGPVGSEESSCTYRWPPTGPSIFEQRAREIKQTLLSHQNQNQNQNQSHGSLPEISFVHVGSEAAARWYCDGRHAFWRYFVALQRGFARDKPLLPPTVGVAEPPPPFRIRWLVPPEYFGQVSRDVDGLDAEAFRDLDGRRWHFGIPFARLPQVWYLTHVMVPEPSRELC